MASNKRSFFEKLTGAVNPDRLHDDEKVESRFRHDDDDFPNNRMSRYSDDNMVEEEDDEVGQLTVDVFQDENNIIVKTIVAGVKPEDLDISITREMITISGKREGGHEVHEGDYFHKELYWGAFSRTVMLPQEVEVEEAQANIRHGLLSIVLPKIDKKRQTKIRPKIES